MHGKIKEEISVASLLNNNQHIMYVSIIVHIKVSLINLSYVLGNNPKIQANSRTNICNLESNNVNRLFLVSLKELLRN